MWMMSNTETALFIAVVAILIAAAMVIG